MQQDGFQVIHLPATERNTMMTEPWFHADDRWWVSHAMPWLWRVRESYRAAATQVRVSHRTPVLPGPPAPPLTWPAGRDTGH